MKQRNAHQSPPISNPPAPWSPALVELYANNFDKLVRQAQRVVCERSLAEECVQEAFIGYHAKGITPKPGAEYAYLRTMVRNGAISLVRSEHRRRNLSEQVDDPGSPCTPETVVVARLTARDLSAEVAQLAPRQAEVVSLRLAGMSVRETADWLQVSTGTVKTHRHRAAAALRASSCCAIAA